MPEPQNNHSNDSSLADSVRRGVSESSRHIPRQIRALPGLAVRTTVIGIGKVIGVTERLRQQAKQEHSPAGRDTTNTTNVPADTKSETPAPEANREPAVSEPTPPDTGEAAAAAGSTVAEEGGAEDQGGPLPVPNYDTLTIGSLRARLRYLDISDLGRLLAYERAHANRSNVVTMYENRILKLKNQ